MDPPANTRKRLEGLGSGSIGWLDGGAAVGGRGGVGERARRWVTAGSGAQRPENRSLSFSHVQEPPAASVERERDSSVVACELN